MSTLDFLTPVGWIPLAQPDERLYVLEREASDKGAENPKVLVRLAPLAGSVDDIAGVTPAELRAEAFDSVDVIREHWSAGEEEYPSFEQQLLAKRVSSAGQLEELVVTVVHIILSDEFEPAQKRLLTYELRCHKDDDSAVMLREFGELIENTQVEA